MDNERDELQPFNPRAREYRYKLWVRVVTPDGVYRYIYWSRLLVASALLAVCGWLFLATVAWAFLRYQRNWQDVSFVDLTLYPARKSQFRAALGQHYIQTGRVHLEQKNYHSAYQFLMSGLRHAPENLDARRTAAITMVRYGLLHRALDTLAGGVTYNPDLEYLKILFGWMLEAKQDERVLALAQQLLPTKPDTALKHRFIALQAAVAHFERGRYDTAEQLIADWGLGDALEGQLVVANCDWERGFRERALQRLEPELVRFGKRDELYLQLIRYYRELGRHDDARRHALLRQFNDPQSPGPRIDLLHAYRATDDPAAEEREMEKYLAEFGTDSKALTLLAVYAAEAGRAGLLERVCTLAEEQKAPGDDFDLARVHLALTEQRYKDALAFSSPERRPAPAAGEIRIFTLIDGLRVVATYGAGQVTEAGSQLKAFLERAQLRSHDARVLAREFDAVGAIKEARVVLERLAQVSSIEDNSLVGEIIRLDIAAGNRAGLAEYLPKFLAMRRPSRAVLEEALLALDERTDAELVANLRAALENIRAATKSLAGGHRG